MGDLTKNFSRSEFACKGGCGFDDIDLELVELLQELRDELGSPITVTSACRCPDYNAKVGGSKNSQHLLGKAADIVVKGHTPAYIQEYLNKKYPGKYGLGSYKQFTHIDVRYGRARWNG